MNILFDSMGAQNQVQDITGTRLTVWLNSLTSAGYNLSYTEYQNNISEYLTDEINLLIITTHQFTGPQYSPIPPDTIFSYNKTELGGIQTWIKNGGNLLLFVNHSQRLGQGPYWPINDIQLAASLGISTVFAEFGPGGSNSTLDMGTNPDAPAAIISGVNSVQAWDSGGIVPKGGTVLIPLPSTCTDNSGLDYNPDDLAFSVLYPFYNGQIIVIGHSGIVGDNDTSYPSPGQINSGDNLQFLTNCVAYLTTPA